MPWNGDIYSRYVACVYVILIYVIIPSRYVPTWPPSHLAHSPPLRHLDIGGRCVPPALVPKDTRRNGGQQHGVRTQHTQPAATPHRVPKFEIWGTRSNR